MSVLSELKVGETGIVETLDLPESVQNYLMHLGFLPEAQVTVLRRAPAGDPTVYAVDGMEIALRHETASAIRIHEANDQAANAADAETGASEPDPTLTDPALSDPPLSGSTFPALDEIPASIELMEAGLGAAR